MENESFSILSPRKAFLQERSSNLSCFRFGHSTLWELLLFLRCFLSSSKKAARRQSSTGLKLFCEYFFPKCVSLKVSLRIACREMEKEKANELSNCTRCLLFFLQEFALVLFCFLNPICPRLSRRNFPY